jgi:hypothetical protein
MISNPSIVIPAEAGIPGVSCRALTSLAPEIPASAGMTNWDGIA